MKVAARRRRGDVALTGLGCSILRFSSPGQAPWARSMPPCGLAIDVAMAWIFKATGIAREALAALKLFCEAAQWEKATAALARRTLAEVEKAMRASPAKG